MPSLRTAFLGISPYPQHMQSRGKHYSHVRGDIATDDKISYLDHASVRSSQKWCDWLGIKGKVGPCT